MPFDAGPRREPSEPSRPGFIDEPFDWMDFALRLAVIGPLIVLYSWWVFSVFKQGVTALLGLS